MDPGIDFQMVLSEDGSGTRIQCRLCFAIFFLYLCTFYFMEQKTNSYEDHVFCHPCCSFITLHSENGYLFFSSPSLWVFLFAVFQLEAVPVLAFCNTIYTTLEIEAPQAPLHNVICCHLFPLLKLIFVYFETRLATNRIIVHYCILGLQEEVRV